MSDSNIYDFVLLITFGIKLIIPHKVWLHWIDATSEKNLSYHVLQLNEYIYLDSVSIFKALVPLIPVDICKIRNRTVPFIAQKHKYWGLVQHTLMAVMKGWSKVYAFNWLIFAH